MRCLLLLLLTALCGAEAAAQSSLSVRGGMQLTIAPGIVMDVPVRVVLDGNNTHIRTGGLLRVGDGTVNGLVATNGAGIVCEEPSLTGGVEWAMYEWDTYRFPFITANGQDVNVRYRPRINVPGHRVRIATSYVSPANTPLPSGVTNTNGPNGTDLAADMVDRHWRIHSNTEDYAYVDLRHTTEEVPQNAGLPMRACPWQGNNWNYPLAYQLDLEPQEVRLHVLSFEADQTHTLAMARNDVFALALGLTTRMFLGGAYDPSTDRMRADLRQLPDFPTTEPFTTSGMMELPYSGGETLDPAILAITGDNAIVDWVLVKVYYGGVGRTLVAERAALLQSDGDVVDVDGNAPLQFAIPGGGYTFSYHHRNHLPIATLGSFGIPGINPTTALIDASDPSVATHGTDARRIINGRAMLWPGEVTGDRTIMYNGQGNDRDPILQRIGGTTPTASTSGYWAEDVNLDGQVKYLGMNNDRDLILQSVGGSVPTNTRSTQLP